MSVAPVTPVDGVSLQLAARQSREAAEAMAAAIIAGDMAAAQRYLAVLQLHDPNSLTGGRSSTTIDVSIPGERRIGLGALITAVQAGDMDRARLVVGRSGNSNDEVAATALATKAESEGIAAPKVIDASNAGAVLIDLSARLNAEMSGARSQVEVAADKKRAAGVDTTTDPQTKTATEVPNAQHVPGPGEEENGNTRFTGEAIRSRAQVLHSYSQYLSF